MNIHDRALAARDLRIIQREAEEARLCVERIGEHRRRLKAVLGVDLQDHEPVAATSDGSSTEWIIDGLRFTAHTDTGAAIPRLNYRGPARFEGPSVINGNSLSTDTYRDFASLTELGDLIHLEEARLQQKGRF